MHLSRYALAWSGPALGIFFALLLAWRVLAGDAEQPPLAHFVIAWTTVLASLLALGIHGGYYAIMTWLPTYLRVERGLSVTTTGGYLAVVIVGVMNRLF